MIGIDPAHFFAISRFRTLLHINETNIITAMIISNRGGSISGLTNAIAIAVATGKMQSERISVMFSFLILRRNIGTISRRNIAIPIRHTNTIFSVNLGSLMPSGLMIVTNPITDTTTMNICDSFISASSPIPF